jgi:hypothetical protein
MTSRKKCAQPHTPKDKAPVSRRGRWPRPRALGVEGRGRGKCTERSSDSSATHFTDYRSPTLSDGTSWRGARFPAMARKTDSPADELREDGARAKPAAKAAVDPREKERLDRIAKEDQAKAMDIENGFS